MLTLRVSYIPKSIRIKKKVFELDKLTMEKVDLAIKVSLGIK